MRSPFRLMENCSPREANDRLVRVWDIEHRRERFVLAGHSEDVF